MTTRDATLKLEITSQQAGRLGAESRKTFGVEGGTIGRAPGNRWVLGEGYVSARHAAIQFVDGAFHIEDLGSRNGVFVNDRRVEADSPCRLRSGDRIFIEPYEMVATIVDGAVEPVRDILSLPPNPFGPDDWLEKLGPSKPSTPPGAVQAPAALSGDPRKEYVPPAKHVSPPKSQPSIGTPVSLPADYNPLRPPDPSARGNHLQERRVRERRAARDRRAIAVARPSAAERPSTPDLSDVLAGAGLEGVTVTPEVARQFGQILRVVVGGVLDVLRSRQEVKGEFRIKPTIIKPRRNNPLKHSTDVDDALHNLLLKSGKGYLGPVEAFEDAFNDLRNHQLAMLAGLRVAFEAMFSQFEPERLQQEFDRHTPRARKGALAALQPKPDYWELYRDWLQRLSQDADGTFRTLFGDEFARAYEEQLERLKSRPASADAAGSGSEARGR
jgi:type VI secretion system FHA domain protein